MLSDLIGEVQEVQPVSNMSTAADLLKQGAGECSIPPLEVYTTEKLSSLFLHRLSRAVIYYSDGIKLIK